MSYSFAPAERKPGHLILALCGPTGCGKTYTALLLATGIVSVTGGKIAVVDTERNRALQYAPDPTRGFKGFNFDHAPFEPPFTPTAYRLWLESAAKHVGPTGVVIMDSMSHEHEGEGGVMEMHDDERERLAKLWKSSPDKTDFAAWSVPKQQRAKLANRISAMGAHVIYCFRAKKKHAQTKEGNKTVIIDKGWQPITGDAIPYEMQVLCLLADDDKGRPIVDGFEMGKLPENMRHLINQERKLTMEDGAALARWATLADDDDNPRILAKRQLDDFKARIQAAESVGELAAIDLQINQAELIGNGLRTKLKSSIAARIAALTEEEPA